MRRDGSALLCIVIPAYNEEIAIGQTIVDYKEVFPDAVIVVVDNNSSDRTGERALAELDLSRDLLIVERRQGKGAAVKAGLSRVCADVYIMTDGDNTYTAADAKRLYDILLDQRCDMVVGDRVTGGTYALQNTRRGHSRGNRILTRYISYLANQHYHDVLSGLRIMSRPFVNMLDIRSSGFQLETELNIVAAYVRAKVVEEPIDYRVRPEGSESKLSTVRDGIRIATFGLINWIAFYPLQFFGAISGATLAASLALGFFVFSVFFETNAMPYPSTAVAAAVMGLVGLQAMFAGLITRVITRAGRRRDVARMVEMRRNWNRELDSVWFPPSH